MAKIDWKEVDGTVTSVERGESRGGPYYVVSFNYKVGEHWYGGLFTGPAEYQSGDLLPVQYDPANPEINDLEQREKRVQWILWAVFAGFILIALCVMVNSALRH